MLSTSSSGLTLSLPTVARAITVEIAGIAVPVLSREHLLTNKRSSGRPKDLRDVAWLEAEEE